MKNIVRKLIFTRPKMEKEISKILEKIDINDLCSSSQNISLINSGAVLKINIKDNQAQLLIDAGILGIDKKNLEALEKKIIDQIKNSKIELISTNILFTSDTPLKNNYNSLKHQKETKPNIPNALPNIKRIIAIASGKGGVGKSTLAVNIAISLKKIGFKVGLVDADIYGPSITHMMNLSGKPELEGNLMIPINSYGIDCMSIASLTESAQALAWRGPMVTKALNQLINGVKWNDIDYLIIDLPPGTGDVHLSIATLLPITGAVIISTPGDVAILDATKAINMFSKIKVPVLGVVQNMAYMINENGEKSYIFGENGAKKMAEENKVNFLGDIELDIKIRKSGDEKIPITFLDPSSKTSFNFGRIAENIIDQIDQLSKL